MKSRLLAALAVVPFALACATAGSAAGSSAAKAPCVPKPTKVSGHEAMMLCGPATATVSIGGTSYSFSNGYCTQNSAGSVALQLSLGTAVLEEKPKIANEGKPYFNLSIGKPHTIASAFGYLNGKVVLPTSVIVVKGSIPGSGRFTGTTTTSKPATFSGTWNCHGTVASQTS